MGQRAKDWQDVMQPIIPLDRVHDAFAAGAADHSSSFPLTAFEIVAAYKKLAATERLEAEKRATDEVNKIAFCPQKQLHIDGDGNTEMANPFDHSEQITIPCFYCRRRAFDDARMRFVEAHGPFNPLEIATAKAVEMFPEKANVIENFDQRIEMK